MYIHTTNPSNPTPPTTHQALYGLIGVKDILVAFPNIVGLVLGGLQLALRAIFPAKCVCVCIFALLPCSVLGRVPHYHIMPLAVIYLNIYTPALPPSHIYTHTHIPKTHTRRAAAASAAEDAANAASLAQGATAAGATAAMIDGSSAGSGGKDVSAATATANPIAAARKLSSSKHLLVRNDSFTEMRHQQQVEMAQELAAPSAPALPSPTKQAAASSLLAPEGASAAAVSAVPAAPVVLPSGKDEETAVAAGPMPAAS
jgi:hypothetical protein